MPAALLAGASRMRCSARPIARRTTSRRPSARARRGAVDDVFVAQAQLALLAARQGAWDEAGQAARAAQALVEETGLGDYSTSALAHVATARVALHEGRQDDARAALARAHRLRPLLDHGLPWLTVQVGLELARAHLALGEAAAARTVLAETESVLERRPELGVLVEDARELRDASRRRGPGRRLGDEPHGCGAAAAPLPRHPPHVPGDRGRLFISRNTVKTEAVAIYRKLGASSRSKAIERAVEVGLLDGSIYPPRPISPAEDRRARPQPL